MWGRNRLSLIEKNNIKITLKITVKMEIYVTKYNKISTDSIRDNWEAGKCSQNIDSVNLFLIWGRNEKGKRNKPTISLMSLNLN